MHDGVTTLYSNLNNISRLNAHYITASGIDDLKSKLITASNAVAQNNTVMELGIAIAFTQTDFSGWQSYYGQLNVVTKGSNFSGTFTSENGNQVTISYNNSTWTIYSLNSNKIGKVGEFTVPKNGSVSFTLPSDGVYLVAGYGSAIVLQNGVFLIGGYATASRCAVVNLSGISAVSIDASNTSSLTFTASNSNIDNSITFSIIKLR